jgi:hypothetical protein
MTRKTIILFVFALLSLQATIAQQKGVVEQLITNLHGGMEVTTINGATSYAGYVGTGYQLYFYENKAYVMPQIDVKWGQYKYGNYAVDNVTSIVVPVTVGYNMVRSSMLSLTVYGGVRYEQVIHSGTNTYESSLNNSQFGLTPGASLRLFNKFGVSVSYYYALTSLYKDGKGRASAFNFSINF